MYFVVDQNGGYQALAVDFATEEGLFPAFVDFNARATRIHYDYKGDPAFKVKVDVTRSNSTCTHYLANYVILTVPVGVLENEMIQFQPPLLTKDIPLSMGQYVKLFYKFHFRVGPKYKNEFLFTLLKGSKSADNDEHCMHWQNMEAKHKGRFIRSRKSSYLPNSHIWMCTLTTEAFNKLVSAGDGKRLNATQVDNLLNPLRQIFRGRRIEQSDYEYYYADLNLRDDFGPGAYSDWKIGYTLRQYYEYFGGGPIDRCQHNGCDSTQKWRLHFSGTGSCLEALEFVHGAYFAGQRSAMYVLAEMGQPVDMTNFTKCEDWGDFQLPPVKR